MLLELGNVAAKNADGSLADLGAPSVTQVHIPDSYTFDPNVNVEEFKAHLGDALLTKQGITHRPDDEALLALLHPSGLWNLHSASSPSWIGGETEAAQAFAAKIAEYHGGVQLGKPDEVEDTHFTVHGPPGVVPGAVLDLNALLVNSGRDMWARNLGGQQVGIASASTGTTATTLSDTVQAWTVNQWIGALVVCGGVTGVVQSNTATALTIDRWSNPATPGGAAGATPGATTAYVIATGGAPAWFVGLGNTNTTPVATDISMSGEIVTGGGGLIRKVAPWAHSAGTNTYTLTPVYTANGSDTLPVTVYRIGVFSSMVVAATASTMMFETLLSASATLSSPGDQLTVSELVTGS
jgi:hypothetical protein